MHSVTVVKIAQVLLITENEFFLNLYQNYTVWFEKYVSSVTDKWGLREVKSRI